ncbi:hypothetical protein FB451DRAFT_1366224 [Mycena latifolia]|nr:hypothetical protein FB451DRAFT_1366224 [Mycena latifolia]
MREGSGSDHKPQTSITASSLMSPPTFGRGFGDELVGLREASVPQTQQRHQRGRSDSSTLEMRAGKTRGRVKEAPLTASSARGSECSFFRATTERIGPLSRFLHPVPLRPLLLLVRVPAICSASGSQSVSVSEPMPCMRYAYSSRKEPYHWLRTAQIALQQIVTRTALEDRYDPLSAPNSASPRGAPSPPDIRRRRRKFLAGTRRSLVSLPESIILPPRDAKLLNQGRRRAPYCLALIAHTYGFANRLRDASKSHRNLASSVRGFERFFFPTITFATPRTFKKVCDGPYFLDSVRIYLVQPIGFTLYRVTSIIRDSALVESSWSDSVHCIWSVRPVLGLSIRTLPGTSGLDAAVTLSTAPVV